MHTINLSTETKRRLTAAADLVPATAGAYLVGGCVRDLLAGIQPADYDLAVSGDPESYAARLAGRHGGRPVALGPERHRIFRVVADRQVFDISPLAGDTIAADLKNRDFTINAMAYDLAAQSLIDPLNGVGDLRNRVIRLASPQAFVDDPLRQLRAFRLAVQFKCRLAAQTLQAVEAGAGSIQRCAAERVRTELLKMLTYPGAVQALEQMAAGGLLFDILPELASLKGCLQNAYHSFDVWTHTVAACKALEALIIGAFPGEIAGSLQSTANHLQQGDEVGLLKLALLLHDIGKPATRSTDLDGAVHFYGHGRRGVAMAGDICRRLKLSRRETDYVCSVIRYHDRPLFLFRLQTENQLSKRAVTRFFIHADRQTPDVLLHAVADFAGKHPSPGNEFQLFSAFAATLLDRYMNTHAPRSADPVLITGRDLIAELGLSPSPLFRRILARVETARLAGEITEKRQALDLARRLVERSQRSS